MQEELLWVVEKGSQIVLPVKSTHTAVLPQATMIVMSTHVLLYCLYCPVQGLPRGKVYRYNPVTRETHLLLTGLFYSNGVAVSADDSYLVISETDRLRLVKYWLKGPKVRPVCADSAPGVSGLLQLLHDKWSQAI